MIIIYSLLAAFGVIWLLFVFYVAVMHLKVVRDRGELTGPIAVLGFPTLWAGLVIDAFANCIFPVPFLFMELPRETLVTSRLKRHAKQDTWRGKLARWFCQKILVAFDRCHCD